MKKVLLTFAVLLGATGLFAQDVTIASADFNTCNESLNDTNPVGVYGNDEDETLTICPDGTETILNIYFISFGIGAGDTLRIYDGGDNITAPLIGTYTGTDLSNVNITSNNPQGCLTLHWTSDATDVGDFGAIIYCGPPCNHPLVQVNIVGDTGNPLKICQGESVTFDASPTQFFPGNTLASFEWDFGDNTNNTNSWPQVTHTFDNPGAYRILLNVTDNTGCANLNVLSQLVYVSTTPNFTLEANPPVICPGTTSELSGLVEAVTYTSIPQSDITDPIYIPDAGTTKSDCFFDTIWVSSFAPGSSIESADDIDSLFANMEHTFLTDITIAFECPNGTVVSVYSQGGGLGNVDLGFPVSADDGAPGIGINYYWSPDATNPNWNNISGTEFVDPGGTDGGGFVVSGVYQSIDPFSDFIGCPLNGPWIIRVCDVVGSDDGWIFDWAVFFDPSLYPEDLSFTPVFQDNCQFTYWQGNNLVNDALCDTATVSPTAPGISTYTYVAIDDFGCTYSATTNVTVIPIPIPEAGEDAGYCGDPVQLEGSITNAQTGQTYTSQWTPAGLFNNPNTLNGVVGSISQDTTVYLTVAWNGNQANCFGTDSLRIYLPADPVAFPDTTYILCPNSTIDLYTPAQAAQTTYEWYYSTDAVLNNTDDLLATTNFLNVDSGGYYIVTITDPFCFDQDQTVYYIQEDLCFVLFPNVFTPDNQGNNESLKFTGLDKFPGSTLKVFNRWGTLVYESDNYQNNWTPKPEEASEGTYFYVLGINKDAGMEYHNGSLSLLRK